MSEQEKIEAQLLLQSFYDLLELFYHKNPDDKETIDRILDDINLLREIINQSDNQIDENN